ncbi:class I SAM-dependent methyltransferase [Nonomuraea guangzhouensis]|uniref:Class I SAM-dependent methyltransferase n=1 Tax=Nonomuraea guangzhouensis TaxID=1291555 RepID=A0ABW4G1A9_9ACTN|nr:class I SAM-dependent methyltransferase [Nonomuraea guangzhouensis]
MATEKVRLAAEKATLLATLYGRALDARSPRPILDDRLAAATVARIDHDFRQTGMDRRNAGSVALRARFLDDWAREFLSRHAEATVLHLGCGLDTRVYRLAPPPGVDWYDVDYPDVIDLRRRLYPEEHRSIGTSVTDLGWLDQVPADKPVLVVAEGLFYYLDPPGGRALVRAIVDRFPGGQFVFDAVSPFGLRLQAINKPLKKAEATMRWGIDGPDDLLSISPKLRLVTALSAFDLPGYGRLSASHRISAGIAKVVPRLARAAVFYRLEF